MTALLRSSVLKHGWRLSLFSRVLGSCVLRHLCILSKGARSLDVPLPRSTDVFVGGPGTSHSTPSSRSAHRIAALGLHSRASYDALDNLQLRAVAPSSPQPSYDNLRNIVNARPSILCPQQFSLRLTYTRIHRRYSLLPSLRSPHAPPATSLLLHTASRSTHHVKLTSCCVIFHP